TPGVASPGGANQPTRASRPAPSTQHAPTQPAPSTQHAPTQPAPSTRPAAGRRGESPRPVRARQLALPLRGGWPEDHPARPVLGRDGQYRLPITVTPRPRRAQPPRAPRVPLVPLPPEAAGQPAATPGTPKARQRRLPVRTLAAPPPPALAPVRVGRGVGAGE
ncbi:MAG TPA: hypothetical protein VE196_11440, partial [Pseudonocardiaceae bacterium]|nr:hypothetical protein [Pseudonocardiaceae bacterium]